MKSGLDNLLTLAERKVTDEYTLLFNNFMFIIINADDEIYDWGIIDFPEFELYKCPVFNIELDNCKIVFGISTNHLFTFGENN